MVGSTDGSDSFRILPQQNTAALALGQSKQLGKETVSKENGASGKGSSVFFDSGTETENLPLCFF